MSLVTRPADTPGKLIVAYAACVVANDPAVARVTAHAMLIDPQGRMIALTNGQPECDPGPPTGLPSNAPPVVMYAAGDSSAITKAQSQNLSDRVIILVSWTDKAQARHQDSFYVPYRSDPARAAKRN